jgi:hypothetical protein
VRPAISLGEIVRQVGPQLEASRPLTAPQRRVLRAIAKCQTPALGGHLYGCTQCDYCKVAWNSCRDRHCPRCQFQASRRWLDERQRELLPIPYFHVVFTIPDLLNPFALADPGRFYDILFRAASQTLLVIGRDPRHLGVVLGFLAVLHTWGQTLPLHPHLHCVVPGGGFSILDGRFIVVPDKKWLLSVDVLASYFRNCFLDLLGRALRESTSFRERTAHLDRPDLFMKARATKWVVFAKAPFGGPAQVLAYLARYTHRIAISEHRLLAFDGNTVRFSYKDYHDHGRKKILELDASEFLRRFLLHVLPDRFVRIRYYGFLGNRVRAGNLSRIRRQLGQASAQALLPTAARLSSVTTPSPLLACPRCGAAPLIVLECYPTAPAPFDSS